MKNSFNGHREFSPDTRSRLIEAYRASGLGLRQFARQESISPGRLHYWVYQKGRTTPSKVVKQSAPARVSMPVFQEVRVGAMLPALSGWAAEVSLPRGLAVRFSVAATAEWISSVVAALQRSC